MHVVRKRTWAVTVGVVLAVLVAPAIGAVPAAAATLPFGTVRAVAASYKPDRLSVKPPFSATCRAGERVLGGGALTVGGVHAVITEMQPIHPDTGLDRFEVSAAADQFGISIAWGFQVFAFCGVVPASAELEIIPKKNLPTSGGTDTAPTQCSPGKFLVGAGGKIEDGGGQVDLGVFPNANGQIAFGSGAFAKEDLDGFAGQYTVTGYSVCLRPNNLFNDIAMVRTQFQALGGVPSQKQPGTCPAGMALTGLAGGTTTPGTHLQEIAPTTAGRPAPSAAFVAQSSVTPTDPWLMDTTVFCAR
jgi:hypothetical protein